MKHQPTTATLSNGLRVVHTAVPRSNVGIFGLYIKAGSRNENESTQGLAHFVEHTLFKGTEHRRAAHIIKRMETVGGDLNAFTTKEETVVYSTFPAACLSRAVELIADLVQNSVFPRRELDKEREVVADEIASYLDSPADAVFDDFEDLAFAGSSLGHNILGNAECLRTFDSSSCRQFVAEHYTASNMVAFYSGPRRANAVLAIMARYLTGINSSATPVLLHVAPKLNPPFHKTHALPIHQAHCVMGTRVGGYLSSSRYADTLLANIMGGPGMNSLLNVELRERRGLVYNVEVSTALFSDSGLLTVYFGCDPTDVERCCTLVDQTFQRFPSWLTPARLEAAKRQFLGQLLVAAENRENSTLGSARSLLWRNCLAPTEETKEQIAAITLAQLIDSAQTMAQSSTLIFAPLS